MESEKFQIGDIVEYKTKFDTYAKGIIMGVHTVGDRIEYYDIKWIEVRNIVHFDHFPYGCPFYEEAVVIGNIRGTAFRALYGE